MIKKTISYDDFDGNPVVEDHYFHLSKSKLVQMDMEEGGGLAEKLTFLTKSGDVKQQLVEFKNIIGRAYGLRDPANAKRFVQSEEITTAFMDSLAFDALFMQIATGELDAAEFINGIIPKGLADDVAVANVLMPPAVPDPNGVDSENGTWPRGEISANVVVSDEDLTNTGLEHPYSSDGNIVPWAYREPTQSEMTGMPAYQMLDVYRRKSNGWTPPVNTGN